MLDSRSLLPGGTVRLVLSSALAAGLAFASMPHTGTARAADRPGMPSALAQATTTGPATTREAPTANVPGAKASAGKESDAKAPDDGDSEASDADTTDAPAAGGRASRDREIVINKGNKHIRIQGIGRDREYDSFEQFVQDAPWLATLVFLVVLMVFLVPLLIIVLLIWYKMRKNRLANETMLKLAERGVVTPSDAMDAVATGNAPALAAAAPASTPAYERARSLQRRVVWSDLRKGVIFTSIGLGLSAFSMFDDGTPNSVGLVCLFVGLGYCLLWFFEHRTTEARRDTTGAPPAEGA